MRSTPARSRPGRATDPVATALTGLGTAVVAMTYAGADGVLRSADPGTDFDRGAPLLLLAVGALLLGAILACWMVLQVEPVPAAAVALALAVVTAGWWAGWVWLADVARALVLALPVLAVPALTAAVLGWHGGPGLSTRWRAVALIATCAAVMRAIAYDPFADVDCLRTCARVRPAAQTIGIGDPDRLLAISTFLAVAAICLALVTVLAAQGSSPLAVRLTATIALVVLGAGVAFDGAVDNGVVDHIPLDLASIAATTLVGIAAGTTTARLLARRRSADLLIRQLRETTSGRSEPSRPFEHQLSRDLTPAQRLALANAHLEQQSRASLADTRAAQQQVIRLADDERVRIERDLHDSAQQLLVTAALHVSVATTLAEPGAGPSLAHVRGEVMDALGELRRISHGPFPSVLLDEGLVAGLEELVADHGGRLVVDGDLGLVDRTTGAGAVRATYAVLGDLLAGLQPGAEVTLRRSGDSLHVTVASASGHRVELSTATLDRLEAAAGHIVDDASGRLEVWVPCGS